METTAHLFERDSERLQITYDEYVKILEQTQKVRKIKLIGTDVMLELQHVASALTENLNAMPPRIEFDAPAQNEQSKPPPDEPAEPAQESAPEPTEEPSRKPAEEPPPRTEEPKRSPPPPAHSKAKGKKKGKVPPIKKNVAQHFNRMDPSGNLYPLFVRYYNRLNEMCPGTVTVTMKDGICSFWNYDEWEEFAFVDVVEGGLRIALDPRYAEALGSHPQYEAPRLLANRRKLVSIIVTGLDDIALSALTRAFSGK